VEQKDWSVLSGPRVSRRALIGLAAATGATAYASQLARAATPTRPLARRQDVKTGGTLRLGMGITDIPTLDPAQETTGIIAGELLANIFSGLVQFDEELGIVADLAETWEVSGDGLEYTFHLRPDLTFHNGDPLTAEDFVYTWRRTTDPDFASPHANKLRQVEEVIAQDERTVVIAHSAPFAPFLAAACSRGPGRALNPISRRAIDELGNDGFARTPVGCGPFMVEPESVDLATGFTMVAFDDWYGGRPPLDAIEVTVIPEVASRMSALEAGDIDRLDIVPAIGVDQVAGRDDFTIVEAPGTNWWGLRMNLTRPPWDNPDARMAVAKAIDRDDFNRKAFLGKVVPCVGPIAPAFAWAYQDPETAGNPQAFDLDEANRLAESAGIVGATTKIMLQADDPRPAETLRNQLAEIGLEVELDLVNTTAYFERWDAGDYDMNITGSVVDADPDDNVWNYFASDGPWNTHGYANQEVDTLLEQERTSTDQAERAKFFQQIQAIAQQDAPFAFLYHEPDRTVFVNKVQGYVPIPEQRYLETIWLDQ
jgi:peptide/nickel transport system substrate-binding protein